MPDRGLALLAITGIIGGGAVSYFATASTLAGEDKEAMARAKKAPPDAATYILIGAGALMTLQAYREVATEVGWAPLVIGSATILGLGLIARR